MAVNNIRNIFGSVGDRPTTSKLNVTEGASAGAAPPVAYIQPYGTAQNQVLITGATPFYAKWSGWYLAGTDGCTYTLPSVSGSFAFLNVAQTFTAAQKINVSSTAALLVEHTGTKNNVFNVDTTIPCVSINTALQYGHLHVDNTAIGNYYLLALGNASTTDVSGATVTTGMLWMKETYTCALGSNPHLRGITMAITNDSGLTGGSGSTPITTGIDITMTNNSSINKGTLGFVMNLNDYVANPNNGVQGCIANSNAYHTSGTMVRVYGFSAAATMNGSGGTTTTLAGMNLLMTNQAGTSTDAYGLRIWYRNTGGSSTNYAGLKVQSLAFSGGTVTTGYGVWVTSLAKTAGTLTTAYAMYVDSPTAGATNWNAYFNGTANNYFGGAVGIGTTPLTQLHTYQATATTNAVVNLATWDMDTTGTAAANFGQGHLFRLETSTTAQQDAARNTIFWTDATHATRTSAMTWELVNSAAALTEVMRLTPNGLKVYTSSTTALLVESVGQPNTFIVNTSQGYAGIRRAPYDTMLEIKGVGAGQGLYGEIAYTLGSSSGFNYRAYAVGTPSGSGKRLGGLIFGANFSDDTKRHGGASVEGWSESAWVDGADYGAYLTFETTTPGTTGSTEKMRLTGAGYLGIGMTPTTQLIEVLATAANGGVYFANNTTAGATSGALVWAMTHAIPSAADQRLGGLVLGGYNNGTIRTLAASVEAFTNEAWSLTNSGGYLRFYTTAAGTVSMRTEKMRLTGDGKLGIGTTPTVQTLEVHHTGAGGAYFSCDYALGTGSGASLWAFTSLTPNATDQRIGLIVFGGISTGTTRAAGSGIQSFTNEAWSVTNTGADLRFMTTAAGTTGRTEKMRLDGAGFLGLGMLGATVAPTTDLEIYRNSNGTTAIKIINADTGTLTNSQIMCSNAYASGYSAIDAVRIVCLGTSYSGSGAFKQDGAVLDAGTNLSGGLSICARNTSTGDIRFYSGGSTDATLRMSILNAGVISYFTGGNTYSMNFKAFNASGTWGYTGVMLYPSGADANYPVCLLALSTGDNTQTNRTATITFSADGGVGSPCGQLGFSPTSGYLDITYASSASAGLFIRTTGSYTTRGAIFTDGSFRWDGDIYFNSAGSGLPYGSCWGNEIGWSQASAAQNTWYTISHVNMSDGQLNNVTHDGSGKLTVTYAGKYRVSYSCSAEVSTANKHIETAISINGTAQNDGRSHFESITANAQIPLTSVAILSLTASQYIEIQIRTTDAGTPNLAVDHLNVVIEQVGG